ncbi:hypothetical protein AN2V17_43620 [Vallitalea sp. AN17-2]|uniref:Uncharacterized protein n=1 Tax=Vallitalea maricola TaxID=3074433 RepID=A0ACB5URA3_9FIRM|nr:hypothetical protein AN2V17_43620 [Vallitalea sp. AN17-2]
MFTEINLIIKVYYRLAGINIISAFFMPKIIDTKSNNKKKYLIY